MDKMEYINDQLEKIEDQLQFEEDSDIINLLYQESKCLLEIKDIIIKGCDISGDN